MWSLDRGTGPEVDRGEAGTWDIDKCERHGLVVSRKTTVVGGEPENHQVGGAPENHRLVVSRKTIRLVVSRKTTGWW